MSYLHINLIIVNREFDKSSHELTPPPPTTTVYNIRNYTECITESEDTIFDIFPDRKASTKISIV